METSTSSFVSTDRTRLHRRPQRAVYDKAQVHAILDEGYVCHVAFALNGRPYVIPTAYGRDGDTVYVHGSAVSRIVRESAGDGLEICFTVTVLDALVLARASAHSSFNYRSVVAYGKLRLITDLGEKSHALRCFTNHVARGRWEQSRPPTEKELKATGVLALRLEEVSAKVRTGPPIDDEEDYALPVWGGVVPVLQSFGLPVWDGKGDVSVAAPRVIR